MTLDPVVRSLLEAAEALRLPSYREVGPAAAREQSRAAVLARQAGHRPPEVAGTREVTVAGPGGPLPLRVVTPAGDGPFPLVVHLHGGGWTVGDATSYDWTVRRLARDLGAVVVDVGYRLAPETPYPGAVEDCWAALLWAAGHAAELGADPARVGVTGDSAGGNLAAVLTLRARDGGGPALAAQLLVYPSVSMVSWFPSLREHGEGLGLDRDVMAWFRECYLPDPARAGELDASPYEAPSLAGLPPAVVAVAECDPLRDGGIAYAGRLLAAGVPTWLVVAEGQVHGYVPMALQVPLAERAVAASYAAFRALLQPPAAGGPLS